MPLILNIHTPAHSYALPYRSKSEKALSRRVIPHRPHGTGTDIQVAPPPLPRPTSLNPDDPAPTENESSSGLIDRIVRKSGLDEKARAGVKDGRDGGLLQYEYEGGRWTLQDGQYRLGTRTSSSCQCSARRQKLTRHVVVVVVVAVGACLTFVRSFIVTRRRPGDHVVPLPGRRDPLDHAPPDPAQERFLVLQQQRRATTLQLALLVPSRFSGKEAQRDLEQVFLHPEQG